MGAEVDSRVTAYVRHVLIGIDTKAVKDIAQKIGVSKAWVTNVRDGKQNIGGESLGKVAAAYADGSIDTLRKRAADFAATHPELIAVADEKTAEEVSFLAVRDREWLEAVLEGVVPPKIVQKIALHTAWQHNPLKTKPRQILASANEIAGRFLTEPQEIGRETNDAEVTELASVRKKKR